MKKGFNPGDVFLKSLSIYHFACIFNKILTHRSINLSFDEGLEWSNGGILYVVQHTNV